MNSILLNKLIVVGIRKNYTVDFYPGVNIIYGDSTTGKSGILNLVNYLLGAKKFDIYPEIEAAAQYAALDLMLNDVRYTIKRDIFEPKKLIEVYQCSFEEVERFPCKKYIPSFQNSYSAENYGFFSEFLFDALNLTNLKLKDSPSKDQSGYSRLSFRDLIKYCYVDQDDLGSKKFLDRGNYVLESKNAQVFKYIFNTLDNQISDVEQEISIKAKEKSNIEKKFKNVSEFLRESDFGSMVGISDNLKKIEKEIDECKIQLSEINKRATADNDVYEAAKSALMELELETNEKEQSIYDHEAKIEQFTRLKNDYLVDIEKFKAAEESKKIIGQIPEEFSICPICKHTFDVANIRTVFDIPETDKVRYEINSLNRRIRDTKILIAEHRKKWEMEREQLKSIIDQKNNARKIFDLNAKELVSPYLAERDTFVSKLASLEQKKDGFLLKIKLRNQHLLLSKNIELLELSISKLNEKLNKLKEQAPSLERIKASMADNLKDYLEFVKIKNPTGISLSDDKFFPKIRGIEYQNITSGGLRTITCIGYLCSFLAESLITEMNYPPLLMIDTVGKYLGKTQDRYIEGTSQQDDESEGVSDPIKYQNIYEFLIELSKQFENNQRTCQMILVDNDVPRQIMDKLSGFIVARFSSDPTDSFPVGFIDDADTYDRERP